MPLTVKLYLNHSSLSPVFRHAGHSLVLTFQKISFEKILEHQFLRMTNFENFSGVNDVDESAKN